MQSTAPRTRRLVGVAAAALAATGALLASPLASAAAPARPTVSSSDASALQKDQSGSDLEFFISNIESFAGSRSNVRAFANKVVGDHQTLNLALENLAAAKKVVLPTHIRTSDAELGKKVVAAVGTPALDQVYLQVMRKINGEDAAADIKLQKSTSDAAVRAFAARAGSVDGAHLRLTTSLLGG